MDRTCRYHRINYFYFLVDDISRMTNFRAKIDGIKTQGSTHKGVDHWKQQRITAVTLIPLSIWFLFELMRHTQADYHKVLTWVAQPWVATTLAVFLTLVTYHSALGLQVVIEDYVPNPLWQKILIIKVKILSLILAILSLFFIIRIAIITYGLDVRL
jgi:succinate dehydrogenase / fumarate reductase membrane anchor subunit